MRVAALLAALAAAALAQAHLGWWALALVGFVFGFFGRSQPWPAVRFGAGVAAAGAARLAYLQWSGAPVSDLHRTLVDVTSLPVLTLSLVVPAVAALCAAWLGAAAGRRLLFG